MKKAFLFVTAILPNSKIVVRNTVKECNIKDDSLKEYLHNYLSYLSLKKEILNDLYITQEQIDKDNLIILLNLVKEDFSESFQTTI